MPFAQAHKIAGAAVRYCESRGIDLPDLTPADLPAISPELDDGVLGVLSVEGAIASRDARGGTAASAVRRQLDELSAELEEFARTDATGAGAREHAIAEELHREAESLHGH